MITNERFPIRKILALGAQYGFGRTNVKRVTDAAQAVSYLCKYLSETAGAMFEESTAVVGIWQD